MSRDPLTHAPRLAILWMVIASIAFASLGAVVKWTAGQMDIWVVILGRSIVTAGLAFAWMHARGLRFAIGNPRWMLLRCTAGFIAMAAYFHAIQMIPLANAIALQYTAPLFIALLSGVVLREHVSPRIIPAVIAACAGATCIASPNLDALDVNALIALLSAFLTAIAYLAIRGLRTSDSPEGIVFWFALFASLGALPAGAIELHSLSAVQWMALAAIGLAGTLGQVGLTRAYHHAPAAFTGAFSYTTVVVGLAFGWFLFAERPTSTDWIGVALIVGSGLYLAREEASLPTPASASSEISQGISDPDSTQP